MMNIRIIRPYFAHRRRPGHAVVSLVVLHATAGSTLDGAVTTLRERGLGYHYLIDKDGTIWKGCHVMSRTGHAGNSYGPNEAAAGLQRVQNLRHEFIEDCSVNYYSIGISFVNENDGQHPYTEAQEQAVRNLIRELRAALPSLRWLTTHAIVSPGRKTDPRGFDVNSLGKDVGMNIWRP